MGGKLFIGNQKVTPIIFGGGGSQNIILPIYYVGDDGKLQVTEDLNCSGITDSRTLNVAISRLFEGDLITSLSCPDIKLVGAVDFNGLCKNAKNLKHAYFNSLEEVDKYGFYECFYRSSLEGEFILPSLRIIREYSFEAAFYETKVVTIRFPLLDTFYGESPLGRLVEECKSIKDIYLNGLKTTSFITDSQTINYMLYGATPDEPITIHFPSNLESTIEQLETYPNFGGPEGYVILAFDLPPTS